MCLRSLKKKESYLAKKQKGSTVGIVYVLVRIRTQVLALILLLVMPAGRCTTALSCLLVKWIGPIDYLKEANSFTPQPRARARGGISQ